MGAEKKRNMQFKEKKPDGSYTPVSGKVPVSEDIKKKAKELKQQALKVGRLTEEESMALASQMALGLVNDRFGLEMSVSDRLKALQLITDYNKNNKGSATNQLLADGDKLVLSIRKLANGK